MGHIAQVRRVLEKHPLLAAGGFSLIGVFIGVAGVLCTHAFTPASGPRALRESDLARTNLSYHFIDPLIGIKGAGESAAYDDLKKQVATYISSQKNSGLIGATVYFRDINASGGFNLNPDEQYTPASLNKVPVMIAYYKIAESNQSILSDQIFYSGVRNTNSVEEIRSADQLQAGHSYSVEQLIEHMIRYSDNNAVDLLLQHLQDTGNGKAYIAVFSDLGIDPQVLTKYTDNMTAQEYAIFLRVLYNATYLDRPDSEHALQLLSETDFSNGIEAGVPNATPVAQKFGEVRMTDSDGNLLGKELNNCGIVYYPEHPYLLCIMTKASGDNIPSLENTVSTISGIVYKSIQKLHPQ